MDFPPIVFPIPIRPGVVVQVQVPWDLSKVEAAKVVRVVEALANDRGTEERAEDTGPPCRGREDRWRSSKN
jgi:hypothetical protein